MQAVDVQQVDFSMQAHNEIPIISGTFNALPLYLIIFDTLSRKLRLQSRVPAHGPHQYLALSPGKGQLYATSWGVPAKLWSWAVEERAGEVALRETGSVPITAVSSYITVTNSHIYSMGGPTGEIHAAPRQSPQDEAFTGFGEKIQEMVYVPQDQLAGWDKTNKALRYGTHAIEFGPEGRAYVPDLGKNCIHVHQRRSDGTLDYVAEVASPREQDGPRHVVVSKDGKRVYAVTEHTQYLDVYDATEDGLRYVHSASVIPPGDDPHDYRGDTLRLSKSTSHIFVTTRGKDSSVRGHLVAFELSPSGHLARPDQPPAATYQTPTSGGKANAIEVTVVNGRGTSNEQDWIVLTDGEEGFVMVLGWDGERFAEIDRVHLEEGDLASHAIWLDAQE